MYSALRYPNTTRDHAGHYITVKEKSPLAIRHSGMLYRYSAVLLRNRAASTWQILHSPHPETFKNTQEEYPSQANSSHQPAWCSPGPIQLCTCCILEQPFLFPPPPALFVLQDLTQDIISSRKPSMVPTSSPLPVWILSAFLIQP